MKHDDVWRALDTLAAENGLSASGLARRAVPVDGERVRAPRRTGAEDVGRPAVGQQVAYDDALAHHVGSERVAPGRLAGMGF